MKATIQAWLTEQFGPDPDLHAELYADYASGMKALAQELRVAQGAHDLPSLAATGHSMKGMALQMGDNEVADPCFALQKAGQAGDFTACEAVLPTIQAAVAAL